MSNSIFYFLRHILDTCYKWTANLCETFRTEYCWLRIYSYYNILVYYVFDAVLDISIFYKETQVVIWYYLHNNYLGVLFWDIISFPPELVINLVLSEKVWVPGLFIKINDIHFTHSFINIHNLASILKRLCIVADLIQKVRKRGGDKLI